MNRFLEVKCVARRTTVVSLLFHPSRPSFAVPASRAPGQRYSTRISYDNLTGTIWDIQKQVKNASGVELQNIMTTLHYDSPLEVKSQDGSQQPRWGWPIYRTAYGDDKKFKRYMKAFFASIENSLNRELGPELKPYMDWPVIEGAHLDALSSAGVRRQFEEWALERGVSRFEPEGSANSTSYSGARFHHCLMVDRRALGSLGSKEPFIGVVQKNWPPQWDPVYLKGETSLVLSERLDLIEGNPTEDVGWFYMPVYNLVWEYDCMSTAGYQFNQWAPRPPDVFDSDLWYEEKWKGDEEEGHSNGIEPCPIPYTYID